MGDTTFLGSGLTVDTSKPFTVVTQFITSDNTTTGTLSEIRRIYVQNGKVIQNSNVNVPGIDAVNSITENFCAQQKSVFGDTNYFDQKGGLKQVGEALTAGMVLSLSLWDDHAANMLWLDSDYPTDKSASSPGVARGTCATTSGVPADVESQVPNSSVTFSNIKWGSIGSTFSGTTSSSSSVSSSASSTSHTTSSSSTSTASSPTGSTVAEYGQCGGIGYTGSTVCAGGFTCHVINACKYLISGVPRSSYSRYP